MEQQTLEKNLVAWYQRYHRDLPWRKTKDPYAVWISEIMLQQTQVQTVIPYYQNFLAQFPNVQSLANANLEEIYKCWEGLGYYSRARHLQAAASQIMTEYHGIFPDTYEELLTLKGIGPYTAAAIASIVFGKPKGAVDGNVLRIISRIYQSEENIALPKTKQHIQSICDKLISEVDPSAFNQGMMDLGATICKPRQPLCEKCPLQTDCLSYHNHKQERLPVNIKKVNRQTINYITCLISYEEQYFLFKPTSGLLANLYALPQYEVESPHSFEAAFYQDYQEEVEIYRYLKDVKHVFTHRTWQMHVYLARFLKKPHLPLYNLQEISTLPISTAHKKVIKSF